MYVMCMSVHNVKMCTLYQPLKLPKFIISQVSTLAVKLGVVMTIAELILAKLTKEVDIRKIKTTALNVTQQKGWMRTRRYF